jgi:hypothetical protein
MFKVNWAFFVAQVSGMGARGHKGKGGHVDSKGKKNSDCHYVCRKDIYTILINLDSLVMNEKEVITKTNLNEK